MKEWEIWFAKFPYEEDTSILKNRPVIIMSIDPLEVLSVKVTSHDVRDSDCYDIPIVYWKECGLDRPSVARISKTIYLSNDRFSWKIGDLHIEDQKNIINNYTQFINNK